MARSVGRRKEGEAGGGGGEHVVQKEEVKARERVNGRVVGGRNLGRPLTIWERLKEARLRLEAQPRVDDRFVSNRRPLDCIDGLRASIAVTLFADGYTRHDWTTSASVEGGQPDDAKGGAKNANVATMLRYPYDRHSKAFLQALDLGLMPPLEDLPEPAHCFYYDGCLIADVYDLRHVSGTNGVSAKLWPEVHSRVLLRPDMSLLYEEIDAICRRLDRKTALLVEQKIVNATATPIRCHPNLPPASSPVQHAAVYTNTHPLNMARSKKRRRVCRSAEIAEAPSVSKSAMLLVRAADRYQEMQRHAMFAQQPAHNDISPLSTNTLTQRIPSADALAATSSQPSSTQPHRTQSMQSQQQEDEQTSPANSNTAAQSKQKEKRLLLRPPKQLLQLHLGKSSPLWANPAPTPPSSGTKQQQDRIRIIRMISLDAKTRHQFQQAQAQADSRGGTPESIERVKAMQQQALLTKANKQLCILDMVRKPGRGCEIVIFRGLASDKSRDMFRVHPGSVEQGHLYLDQYKAIMKKEGYVCLHDLNPPPTPQAEANPQSRTAPQQGLQASTAAPRQQPPQLASSAPSSQATMLNARTITGSQTGPQLTKQQILQAKQKQLQMQRQQQQLQRPRQLMQQAQHQSQQNPQKASQLLQTVQQPAQHAPQAQLPQAQHQQHMTLQQQQLLRQHQLHQLQQQQQSMERARRLQQQMQRHDKSNVNIQQSAAALAANGRGGQILSKAATDARLNVAMVGNPSLTGTLNSSAIANSASAAMLGHNQMLTPSQMQQIQQMRNHQLHPRNMMAAVGNNHVANPFPRNGNIAAANALTAQQQLQNQALSAAGIVGSGALGSAHGRQGSGSGLSGADALAQHRLQQHFKQQRENVEAQARSGKR